MFSSTTVLLITAFAGAVIAILFLEKLEDFYRNLRNPWKMKFMYPQARRDASIIEDLHGHKVADPYRWLEDPDAEETKEFVDAQNAITMPYLENCRYRKKIEERLTELWDYPKYGCPFKRGDRYYYFMNTGLQNQSVLYVQERVDGESKVFLDPNLLSDDGTTAITTYAFSEDGKIFSYGLSERGSDWVTIKFKYADTGDDLNDVLKKVKFSSLSWTHDHKGVFYNIYPEQEGKTDGSETTSNLHHKLYYHYIGTEQSSDVLVAELPEQPKLMIGCEVSDCGRYLIIYVRDGCKPVNKLYISDLHQLGPEGIRGVLPVVKLIDTFDGEYQYITNVGTVFTLQTNHGAPRSKLLTVDISDYHNTSNWKTLIGEHDIDVLEWSACVNNNQLLLCYMQHVKNVLYVHDLASGERITTLPIEMGAISSYSGKKKLTEVFFSFTSFLTPGRIYHVDMTESVPTPTVFREITTAGFTPDDYKVEQVFYPSKDGTRIPMFLVHRKDLALDGNSPTLLYGYGGFNIALTPYFSITRIILLQHFCGVFALANIRGGGEYGISWNDGGKLDKKQNCFDDFISAGEFLAERGYTSPRKLSIMGGSNGGLLVGAVTNQRPELFRAVICQVGVMDVLRFHRFTIGHAWTSDFGNPDSETDFHHIIKYSPLHNINVTGRQYPSMLLLTADHDDRVVPLHSLKYMATLHHHVREESDNQVNPLVIRVDTKAGHGRGKPTAKQIQEYSDIFAFLAENLDIQWKD